MKLYIYSAKHFPGTGSAYYATNMLEKLFSKTTLKGSLVARDDYMKWFYKTFKVLPFDFDNHTLINRKTQEVIVGPEVNHSSYKDFTEFLINYFNIPISSDLQERIDKIKNSNIYIIKD